jgi:hypothetical protein
MNGNHPDLGSKWPIALHRQRERDLDFVAPMDVNIDFGLDDRGEIVLKETGEETEEIIAKECYPELEAVFAVPGTDLRLRYQFGSG